MDWRRILGRIEWKLRLTTITLLAVFIGAQIIKTM